MQSLELAGIEAADVSRVVHQRARRRERNRYQQQCLWMLAISLVVLFFGSYLQTNTADFAGEELTTNNPTSGTLSDSAASNETPSPGPVSAGIGPDQVGNNDGANNNSSSDNESEDCRTLYECQTDRLGHEAPLLVGQALCNDDYRFGLTPGGVFQWHDCATDERRVIYDPSTAAMDPTPEIRSFVMSETATLRLMGSLRNATTTTANLVWEKESKITIQPTEKCLHRPLLDCPYLHLHKDGVVVLNYINHRTGSWSDRKIQKCFDDLFHEPPV